MKTFQIFVILLQLSAAFSLLSFIAGVFFHSWKWMFASCIIDLPIAYYFFGAENNWKLVGYLPILLFAVSEGLWKKRKHKQTGALR
ncbi:hypothetical protein [Niallia nealsonii]|uniref:Uncharacterized protein n=1 Tax=Niallia nealsonii TaxID=115979 RepID=A0A2N0Z1A6_9BACI|nr:hypothetical protein [Niallia nealsonii]PKG23294.1 hypothetical protein CWS01_12655 [Niallia nealsonii]